MGPLGRLEYRAGRNGNPGEDRPEGSAPGDERFRETELWRPLPPSGTHRYFFKLYALDISPGLKTGATKGQLEEAMKGHILEKTELLGLYRRK